VNAKGEALFYSVLRGGGSEDDEIRALWNKRGAKAQDNFRRCLRYFLEACDRIGIAAGSLARYGDAQRALRGAMTELWRQREHSARVIGEVKTAVSITFGYRFPNKPNLTDDRVAKDLLVSYHKEEPTRKKHLQLSFTWKQLTDGLKTLPPPAELDDRALVGKTACLVRGVTGTRTLEIAQMDREATSPSPDGRSWDFWLRIKGRSYQEKVTVYSNEDVLLDPIAHVLEVRTRARRAASAGGSTSLWLRADGSLMTPEVIRAETARTMQSVGIVESRSYLIKHATVTYLIDRGVSDSKVRNFLRHKQSSKAMEERYTDYHNNQECVKVLNE
jgi:site-specific recombinase XerD